MPLWPITIIIGLCSIPAFIIGYIEYRKMIDQFNLAFQSVLRKPTQTEESENHDH